MDKNMIKIDDFVRQRLSGGEEKERAGAWLQMRDLLDDKMPSGGVIAGGYNWRRMLTAATGLLLIASLTVGGYKMYNTYHPDNEMLAAGNLNSAYKISGEHTTSPASKNYQGNSNSSSNNEESPKDNQKDEHQLRTSENGGVTINNHRAEEISTIKNVNLQTNNNQNGNNTEGENAPAYTKPSSHNETNNNTNDINKSFAGKNIQANENQASINTPGVNNPASGENNNTQNAIARATSPVNHHNESAPITQQPTPQSAAPAIAAEKAATTGAGQVKTHTTAGTKKSVAIKDSMPKIAITEKLKVDPIRRTVVSSKDTTSVSKMVVEKIIPASNEAAIAQNTPPQAAVPQANTGTVAKAESKSTSAAAKTRSANSGYTMADRLKEILIETQFRLGQVKFYMGITGGINNYMYGSNSMMGIQIGPTLTAEFDEKWSMFIEPKYMQRFNKNYVVKDNYWQVGEINGNQYQASEIEHFFKFSALHTIEMPVALRYQLFKQLHIFAGGNLVYNFKINAEEITRVSEEQTYTGSSFGLPYQPSVHLDHFGSRFSAGYLLGLGYQVSPVFDLNARMTKNFWDNAAGSGPRKISDQLLYRPSFQLSIGYRFLQRNKIPPAK